MSHKRKQEKMNDNQHVPSGYKPSPLGIIPEDWEVKTIEECTNLLTNGFVGVATPHYTEDPDGITYIQGFNVTEGGFNLTGIKKVTRAFHKKNSKSSLREGDLLTIQTGDIGLTTIVTKELEGSNCHALIISRFKEMILPQFMLYYYNSPIGRNRFRIIETGTTMKHINTGDLVKFSIPVPSLPEQQRIVSVLSLWDTAIEKQTALIEQLALRKHGLMQQLLTGKKRLKGFEGEWKEVRLGEMLHTLSNGMIYDTTTTDGFKITRIETISDGTININKVGYCEFEPANEFKLQKGDILYSHINSLSHIGKVAYYNLDETIYHGMNLLLLRTNELINNKYLYYLLLSSVSKHQALRYAKPAINQASISTSDIKKFKYKIPHIDEQNAIISVLVNADKEIEIQKQKLAAMQEQKKGLMQVLLTGKRRIKKINQ